MYEFIGIIFLILGIINKTDSNLLYVFISGLFVIAGCIKHLTNSIIEEKMKTNLYLEYMTFIFSTAFRINIEELKKIINSVKLDEE